MAYKSKSYRKFIATGTTAALVATAIAPAASAADHPFVDVNTNYDEAVSYLYNNDITKGYTETTFGTYMSLDRGNAAVIIANALGLDTENAADAGFEDVNSRVAGSVNALVEAGIMDGYSDTEFKPEVELSRGAMAKILVNAYDLSEYSTDTPFSDLTSTFGEYIEALYGAGITSGKTETTFGTNAEILRGEFAVLLYNTINFEAPTSEVASVESINAKQVEITFTKAVDVDSVIKDVDTGELVAGVVTVDAVGEANATGALKGELSEDGKTLTLTAANTFDGRYSVTVVDAEDMDGEEVASYAGFFTADDVTRPTVASVSYTSANTAKVSFSEPVKEWGAITLNGVTAAVEAGSDYVLIDISSLDYEEKGTVTFVGVEDHAGNFVSPNPLKVDVTRPAEDVTKPVVDSMSVVSDSRVKVVFSEELASASFSINGVAVTDVDVDDDTVTYYLNADLKDGVNKVEVTSFEDISGNAGKAETRQFVVSVDDIAPELKSSEVLVDEDGQEFLQLSFSEAIELGTAGAQSFDGKLVVDYVTTNGASFTATPLVDEDDSTKVNIPLQNAEKGTWTVSLGEGFVNDLSQASNDLATTKVSFVRGEDEETTEPTELEVTASEADNVVTLTFNGKLAGATATNVSNYSIEGAAVKSAVLTSNTDTTATVQLTFDSESIVANGDYQLELDGVTAADGTLVDVDPIELNLTENVSPELTSAELVNGQDIVLSFSEAIEASTLDGTDFNVLVDGKDYEGTYTVAAKSGDTTGKKFVVTLSTELTSDQLADAIALELTDDTVVEDLNGNDLEEFESLTVSKNIQ
jgi:hypothetical protein